MTYDLRRLACTAKQCKFAGALLDEHVVHGGHLRQAGSERAGDRDLGKFKYSQGRARRMLDEANPLSQAFIDNYGMW